MNLFKIYEYSSQFLLCGASLNLIYFLTCSVLYFKYSLITHIPSLVMFVVSFIGIILVLFKFFMNPDPFDYFRYSFKQNRFFMEHWFLHISVFTISTIILSVLPAYQVIAMVIFLLMFLYTLIFKPFDQYIKENYRASFNYFVVCSIIGFNVYMQYIPLNKLNSTYTFLYLLINFCILLPAVVFISIISTIYYWVY